jgi:hypothetical protein
MGCADHSGTDDGGSTMAGLPRALQPLRHRA